MENQNKLDIFHTSIWKGLFSLLRGKTGFKIHIKDFIPHPTLIKKVFTIGLPASIGQSVTAIGFSIIMGVVANFGPTVISGYGIGNRINNMVIMFAMGMSLATGAMAGQFVGAGMPEKAKATMEVFIGTLRGTGHTVLSTIVDMVRLWVIRIPLIFFFADLFGYVGIFYAMIISNISAMGLAYVFLRLGNWKEKVVEEYE